MTAHLRFWQSAAWRKAFQPDSGIAEAEGLAAGTGLLTGDVVRSSDVPPARCPVCDHAAEVVVIDLVAHQTKRSCPSCGHRWVTDEPVGSSNHRR